MDTSAHTSWLQITIIYLVGLMGMMVISVALPALPGIGAEFHPHAPFLMGFVMSAPALAAALLSLLAGGLSDRFGDRRVMLLGAALIVLGDIAVMQAPTIEFLLGGRVVAGLGYVCVVVSAVALIGRLTSGRQRNSALALWSTAIPASFIFASLYGATIGQHAAWRTIFLLHAILVILMSGIALLTLPGAAQEKAGASRLAHIGEVVRTPWPFVLGASFAAAAFLQTGFVASLPPFLAKTVGASEAEVHSFNILAMACNIAGAFLFGWLLNRGAKPWQMGIGAVALCVVAGLSLILAPTALIPAMVMNCALMLGLGILVGMWALLPQVAPSLACMGATSGLITQVTLLGVLFGPPAAFASLAAGRNGSLIFLAFGAALSLIAWPVWRRGVRSGGGVVGH